jgi:hypothetical protein
MACFSKTTVAFVLLGATLCAGCESTPEGTWVARVEGADAWLAVKVEGDHASAFVCGGATTLEANTRWLYAEADGEDLSFAQDDVSLDVTVEPASVTGDLVLHGTSVPINAHLAVAKDLEGVYAVLDAGCLAGLIIVAPTEEQPKVARGAWCDNLGHFSQVTPVEPVALTPRGIEATADTMLGFRTLFMQPVAPSDLAP